MDAFLIPPQLQAGDRVHVIAPAGAVPREAFEQGLAIIEAAGFVPVYDSALLQRSRYFAGSHERRQAELLEALERVDTKAIWAARGGYGTGRLLAPISAQQLRAAPKWFVGFSDLTGLHAAYQNASMVSLHGANVTTLVSWAQTALDALFALLRQGTQTLGAAPRRARWRCSFAGNDACGPSAPGSGPNVQGHHSVEGRLWGGNLTVLASLCGTGQLPKADVLGPSILLLEEVGEAPYRLDRCWHQLEASGALRGVAGVALGQLTRCEAKGADYTGHQMLTSAIEAAGLPWVSGLPFGHAAEAYAAPLGAAACLDLVNRALRVHL